MKNLVESVAESQRIQELLQKSFSVYYRRAIYMGLSLYAIALCIGVTRSSISLNSSFNRILVLSRGSKLMAYMWYVLEIA